MSPKNDYKWHSLYNRRLHWIYLFISVCFMISAVGLAVATLWLMKTVPALLSLALVVMTMMLLISGFVIGAMADYRKMIDRLEGMEKKLHAKH